MKIRYAASVACVAAMFAVGVLACSKTETKPQAGSSHESTATAPAAAKSDVGQAQSIFNDRCVACHGSDGTGGGPAAAALNPKPRNYTDKTWQSSVTDEQLKKAIVSGGAGVGKSPLMPANPDLVDKPEVVDGLVKIIRKFGA